MSIALVTCQNLSEPDLDEALLCEAIRARDVPVSVVAWNAAPAPPAPEDHALWVLRSTWDYHHHLESFFAFAARTASRSRLVNPLHLLRWNAHKTYLRDLKMRGVPVVRTAFIPRGSAASLLDVKRDYAFDDVVIKPAVSGGSFKTRRFRPEEAEEGHEFLRELAADRDVLVQGYAPDVEVSGERAVVFIDGELTHSVRKAPRLSGDDESVSSALPISTDERALAEMVLRPMWTRLLYARVDMVRDEGGNPMVMEVEIIEPSLFLLQHPPALKRFADAIAREAREAQENPQAIKAP